MLKVSIHNAELEDSYEFTADTIEEARRIAARENAARGWNDDDCFSEVIGV